MRRMVTESDRELLNTRLDFWRGPLPFDLSTASVGELADFVEKHEWAVLAIDSLKDVTGGMSTDEDGAAINRQFQELLVRGVQLVVNHHDRKGENKSKVLDDVYGSRWLTAGFGSVLYVQGDAGSEVVELRHLKQPADVVGPFTLRHDHAAGVTVVEGMVQIKKVRTPGAGKAEVLAFVAGAAVPHTAVDISKALGVTRELAGRWLRELEQAGQVKRLLGVGTGHSDTWVLP